MNSPIPASKLTLAVELRPKGEGKGVYAVEAIRQWEVIAVLVGPSNKEPSRHTIQIDAKTHLDEEGFVQGYLNHSCEPNAFVDFSKPGETRITSLGAIELGEEVRINYCATEESMAEPFSCNCGAPSCYRTVSGFVGLSRERQEKLDPLLSPYLRKKYWSGKE